MPRGEGVGEGRPLSGREPTPVGEMVADALGVAAISRDRERGAHDFDIELPDGRIIAFEVTAAANGMLVAMHAIACGNAGTSRWAQPGHEREVDARPRSERPQR